MNTMKAALRWLGARGGDAKAYLGRQVPYAVLVTILLGFAVVLFFDRIVISISPGELGVLWRRLGGGTVLDQVYHEGLHIVLPFNRMYIYNVRKQQIGDTIDVLTVDGLTVHVEFSMRYFLAPDTLPLMHQRVGPTYADVVVRPEVRSSIRAVFGQYKPEEIYTSQKAIQEKVNELARQRLEARYVSLDAVPIQTITLPKVIASAIEEKLATQQREKEYVYRLSIAAKEAERRRIEAEGLKVYNNTLSQSLDPSLLKWYGVRATQDLAQSPNSKVVVIGAGESGLPIILGRD